MLSEPFELLQLPRFNQKASNALSTSTDDDFLFVGASGSSLSKLSLKPPQVLRTHSLAPGVVVSSLLASDGAIVAYGSIERSKSLLHLLEPSDDSNSSSSYKTVETPGEIADLFLSADKSAVAVLCKGTKASVLVYSTEDLHEIWRGSNNKSEELVFSSTMQPVSEEDGTTTFVTVNKNSKTSQLVVTAYALDSRGVETLASKNISLPYTAKTRFSLYGSCLYVASGTDLHAFSVPQMQEMSFIAGRNDDNEVKALMALPNNNVAVLRGNELQLLDFEFQSLVSTIKVQAGINTLLNFVQGSSTIVALQGQSIVGIAVSPTKGSLLESIGCGYAKDSADQLALTDIFDGFKQPPQQFKTVAAHQLADSTKEVDSVLRDLESYIKNRDGPAFAEIVTYLKSPNTKKWSEVVAEAEGGKSDDLVYDESTDRNADRKLIQRVCEMAFLPRFRPYIPIGVAVYLLTHPLFPVGEPKFAKVLRNLEKSDAILYRQAIVSLSGLSAADLVRGLLNPDEATFLDAAIRVQEDYSAPQILHGIRTAFKTTRSISALSILIERLSRYPETIGLMAPFIDAMGLLAWNVDHIKQLHDQLNTQIESLEASVKAATAIADLFNTMGLNPSENAVISAGEAKQRSVNYNNNIASNERRVVPKYSIETLVL